MNKLPKIIILLLLCSGLFLSGFLLTGCGRDRNNSSVAVMVNGRPIGFEEVDRAFRFTDQKAGSEGMNRRVIDLIIERLIQEELIFQEAEKNGIKVTEAELAFLVKEIKEDYPGDSFEEMLVKEYVLMDEWLRSMRRSLVIEKATKREIDRSLDSKPHTKISFSPEDRLKLIHPRLVRLRHLTFIKREKAERAFGYVRKGLSFESALKKMKDSSLLPDKQEIQWINPLLLPSPFKEILTKLMAGEYSGVIESGYGFSIFNVIEEQKARPMSPDEADTHLRMTRSMRDQNDIVAAWVKELKEKSKIEINPAYLFR